MSVVARPPTLPEPDVGSVPAVPQVGDQPVQFVQPVQSFPASDRGTRAPRRHHSAVVFGLILIALGVTALFGTWFPAGGAWLFLGLGVAFALARVVTGRSGYAVPGGILLGFGAYVWLTETSLLDPARSGGLFFIFLGLGFLASYAISARAEATWPLVPAIVLIGFGAFVQATMFGLRFGQFWWLAQYWPVSLVALGAWLLLRDRLAAELRTPVAIVGAGVLIVVGLLVAAAATTMVATPYAGGPIPMPWPMFQVPFGNPPLQDSVTLTAPAASIATIRLVNTSGSTVVRAGSGSDVQVQATRHYWDASQAPDLQLVPTGDVLDVRAATPPGTYVDYIIDAPAALGVDLRAASGSVVVDGLSGPVRIETASGSITGTGLERTVAAHSASGSIGLSGDFATDAQVSSTSGSVTLRLTPAASARIEATSVSGDITANGLGLTNQTSAPHRLTGTLGKGGPSIIVTTTSGSIRLLPAP